MQPGIVWTRALEGWRNLACLLFSISLLYLLVKLGSDQEVAVTLVSLSPCLSHRGLFNTNHRLSLSLALHACFERQQRHSRGGAPASASERTMTKGTTSVHAVTAQCHHKGQPDPGPQQHPGLHRAPVPEHRLPVLRLCLRPDWMQPSLLYFFAYLLV